MEESPVDETIGWPTEREDHIIKRYRGDLRRDLQGESHFE